MNEKKQNEKNINLKNLIIYCPCIINIFSIIKVVNFFQILKILIWMTLKGIT
jgi:hypothetical protein